MLGWALLWAVLWSLISNQRQKFGLEIWKEGCVREECVGVHYSGSSGLADKMGKLDKLETFMCCFAKLEG